MRSIHTDFTRGAARMKCDSITLSLLGGIVFTFFMKLSLKFKFLTSKIPCTFGNIYLQLIVSYGMCFEAFVVTAVKSYWTVICVGFVSTIF